MCLYLPLRRLHHWAGRSSETYNRCENMTWRHMLIVTLDWFALGDIFIVIFSFAFSSTMSQTRVKPIRYKDSYTLLDENERFFLDDLFVLMDKIFIMNNKAFIREKGWIWGFCNLKHPSHLRNPRKFEVFPRINSWLTPTGWQGGKGGFVIISIFRMLQILKIYRIWNLVFCQDHQRQQKSIILPWNTIKIRHEIWIIVKHAVNGEQPRRKHFFYQWYKYGLFWSEKERWLAQTTRFFEEMIQIYLIQLYTVFLIPVWRTTSFFHSSLGSLRGCSPL